MWHSYSREQIPPLFGMQFSKAIWNVGHVNRSGHIVLIRGIARVVQILDQCTGNRGTIPADRAGALRPGSDAPVGSGVFSTLVQDNSVRDISLEPELAQQAFSSQIQERRA